MDQTYQHVEDNTTSSALVSKSSTQISKIISRFNPPVEVGSLIVGYSSNDQNIILGFLNRRDIWAMALASKGWNKFCQNLLAKANDWVQTNPIPRLLGQPIPLDIKILPLWLCDGTSSMFTDNQKMQQMHGLNQSD